MTMGSQNVPLESFVSQTEQGPQEERHMDVGTACASLASNFHRIRLPIVHWLPRYNWKDDLFWDVNAGLVVGILLIPQGMAYALLAAQSPIQGLYCAILPNIVYAILGTSKESAVGAMALASIMVGNVVVRLVPNPKDIAGRKDVAIQLALLVGLLQILLGWLKLGSVATYVSHPVMVGFCTAGEILIAVSQLKYLLGIRVPQFEYAFQTLWYLLTHLQQVQVYTLMMGLVTFTALFMLSKWKRRQRALAESDPVIAADGRRRMLRVASNFGPFVAIIVTGFFTYLMLTQWGIDKMDVIGKVPQGFQVTNPLNMTMDQFQKLLPDAFILAIISFMLSFSVSKKYATQNRYEIDNSQELVAQGAADVVAGFFAGFPIAGGFARTAVNVEAGARSQISSVVAACLVALAVNFLTTTFFYIPMCSLAAIVQVAICGVIDFSNFTKAYNTSKIEFMVMLLTFLITLILGIDKGIIAGVAISLVVLIRTTAKPKVRVLGRLPGANVFRDLDRYPEAIQYEGIRILRVDESFNFASCSSIKEQILRFAGPWSPECPPPLHLVIDCCGINTLDMSGAKILEEVAEHLARNGQKLHLANCKAKIRDRLKRQGLFNKFGGEMLYLSLPAAVATLVPDEEDQGMLLADTASSCCGDTHSEAGDSIKGRPTYGQRRWVVEVDEDMQEQYILPHSGLGTIIMGRIDNDSTRWNKGQGQNF